MAISSSPRLGLTRWSADTDQVSRAQFDGDHGRLDDLVAMAIQGVAVDRPAAAVPRRLYYATDTGVLSLDTGTAWVEVLTGPRASAAYAPRLASAVRAIRTTALAVANSTLTTLALDGETYDTDDFHSTVSSTSRLTVPAGKDGVYAIVGQVTYATNGTGERQARLLRNGTTRVALTVVQAATTASALSSMNASTQLRLVAGDYIELQAFQTSGANLDVLANDTWLAMHRIGA
jgi:hypothetical protein